MERKSFLLRIDPTLWAELEAWAASELRSVNGQIEYLLRHAVQKRKGGKPSPPLAESSGNRDDLPETSMHTSKQRKSSEPRRK